MNAITAKAVMASSFVLLATAGLAAELVAIAIGPFHTGTTLEELRAAGNP